MKPSYSIGAKNGLLEQKHLDILGPAIWLYLWFIDKQPKDSDKVLGGKPITYEQFAESYPKVPRRTYFAWLERIRAGGYVELTRTPRGSVIIINKPKKWHKSDVQKMAHQTKSDVQNFAPVVQKMAHRGAENGTSNIKETVKETITNNNTNVLEPTAPVRYGKPEVNDLFDYWEKTVGYPIKAKVRSNRFACATLIKTRTVPEMKRLINGVALAQEDRYAPSVSDFSELQSNMNRFLAWGHKRHIQQIDERIEEI